MNWTNFLLILTLSYLSYYGLNLLYDLFMSRKSSSPTGKDDTLFFEEDIQPQIITYTPGPVADQAVEENEPIAATHAAKDLKGHSRQRFFQPVL
jgi:hypothetical protein